MYKLSFLSMLLMICFCWSCQKTGVKSGNGNTPQQAQVIKADPITANLQGNIIDENDQPVAGVSITAGTKTVITDVRGYFRINAVPLDKNVSFVSAVKTGYFTGYRVFGATTGTNQVVIKLARKEKAGSVNAAAGGKVTLPNGSVVDLPAGGIVLAASGAGFTGDVQVYASYINPGGDDIANALPGSAVANNREGKRVILSTYGIMAIELASPDGQKLQLKNGVTATLTSPIPSAMTALAPNTLSLAYLDEKTGIWQQEGTATRQGNNYVGTVAHFTNWNFDSAYSNVAATVTIHNTAGAPLVNTPVNIKAPANGFSARLYTDSLGQATCFVPVNENLVLEVVDDCGSVVYTKNIAALSQDADLGIVAADAGASMLTVTGTLTDCSGAPVTNGYASIVFNNMLRYAATDASGVFGMAFTACAGTTSKIYVSGIDNTTGQASAYLTLDMAKPTTQTGTIAVCNNQPESEYIQYVVDSTAGNSGYQLTQPRNDSLVGYTSTGVTSISGGLSLDQNFFAFSLQGASQPGTYAIQNLLLGSYTNIVLVQPFNVVFTNFPQQPGDFYEGRFSGQFTAGGTPDIHTIKASFKIKRVL